MKHILFLLCFVPALISAQNVGIGTTNPQEKLQVNGTIYTTQGGVKFPDNTIQTTAALSPGSFGMPAGTLVMTISNADAGLKGTFNANGITDGIPLFIESHQLQKRLISGPGGGTFTNEELLNFSIVKPVDNTSATLFKSMAKETKLNEIFIYLIKPSLAGSSEKVNRLIQAFHLIDVYITDIIDRNVDEYSSEEEIRFNVKRFCKYSYKENKSGNDTVFSYGYNFELAADATCPSIPN